MARRCFGLQRSHRSHRMHPRLVQKSNSTICRHECKTPCSASGLLEQYMQTCRGLVRCKRSVVAHDTCLVQCMYPMHVLCAAGRCTHAPQRGRAMLRRARLRCLGWAMLRSREMQSCLRHPQLQSCHEELTGGRRGKTIWTTCMRQRKKRRGRARPRVNKHKISCYTLIY